MDFVICSIFDSASESYSQPMTFPNDAVAIRNFAIEVNRKSESNMLSQVPEDFELYKIGTFNSLSGRIDHFYDVDLGDDNAGGQRVRLARAKDLIRKETE